MRIRQKDITSLFFPFPRPSSLFSSFLSFSSPFLPFLFLFYTFLPLSFPFFLCLPFSSAFSFSSPFFLFLPRSPAFLPILLLSFAFVPFLRFSSPIFTFLLFSLSPPFFLGLPVSPFLCCSFFLLFVVVVVGCFSVWFFSFWCVSLLSSLAFAGFVLVVGCGVCVVERAPRRLRNLCCADAQRLRMSSYHCYYYTTCCSKVRTPNAFISMSNTIVNTDESFYNTIYCLTIGLKYLNRVLVSTCFEKLRDAFKLHPGVLLNKTTFKHDSAS